MSRFAELVFVYVKGRATSYCLGCSECCIDAMEGRKGNCSANAMKFVLYGKSKLLASVAEGGKPCLTSGEHSEPEEGEWAIVYDPASPKAANIPRNVVRPHWGRCERLFAIRNVACWLRPYILSWNCTELSAVFSKMHSTRCGFRLKMHSTRCSFRLKMHSTRCSFRLKLHSTRCSFRLKLHSTQCSFDKN